MSSRDPSLTCLFLYLLTLFLATKHADTEQASIAKKKFHRSCRSPSRWVDQGGITSQDKICFGRRPHESLVMLVLDVDGDNTLHAGAACMCLRWEDAPAGATKSYRCSCSSRGRYRTLLIGSCHSSGQASLGVLTPKGVYVRSSRFLPESTMWSFDPVVSCSGPGVLVAEAARGLFPSSRRSLENPVRAVIL
jgi:hypothetical protein